MTANLTEEIRARLAPPARVAELLRLTEGAKRQAGGGVHVRCPAHADKTASCSITVGPDGTVRVRCFGCDLAGDAFSLVAAARGMDARRDFHDVVREAARLVGLDAGRHVSPRRASATRSGPPKLPRLEPQAPRLADERFAEIVAPLLNLGRLDYSPISARVCDYIEGRGLLAAARADGWAALPDAPTQREWTRMLGDIFDASTLRRSGLVGVQGGFVWPEHALMIPWRDAVGVVATLQRRRLDGGEPKYVFATGRKPLEPYGAHRLDTIGADTSIVFVEGAVDAAALGALNRTRGLDRVVLGVPGVQAWRASWAEAARGRRAIVAFDRDAAGDVAAEKVAADLRAVGAAVTRERPRGCKDWAAWLENERERGAA